MEAQKTSKWTFFTNHSHVLFFLFQHPGIPLREVALAIGITERAVQKIIADLEEGGIISRKKRGRINQYTINTQIPLRHPLEAHHSIGDVLKVMTTSEKKENS